MTEDREDRYMRRVENGLLYLMVVLIGLVLAMFCTALVGSFTGFAAVPQMLTFLVVFPAFVIPVGRAIFMKNRWEKNNG